MSAIPWAPVYLKAVVTVRRGDAWVDAGAYAATASAPGHVLTAWNPGAARSRDAVNRAANARLVLEGAHVVGGAEAPRGRSTVASTFRLR